MNTQKNESFAKTVAKVIFAASLVAIGSHYGAKLGLKVGVALTGLK